MRDVQAGPSPDADEAAAALEAVWVDLAIAVAVIAVLTAPFMLLARRLETTLAVAT